MYCDHLKMTSPHIPAVIPQCRQQRHTFIVTILKKYAAQLFDISFHVQQNIAQVPETFGIRSPVSPALALNKRFADF